MLTQTLKTFLLTNLENLKAEIGQYRQEQNIWKVEKGISNSAGNLCLHLVGNLNGFIGAQLGNTGYIRQRELEFSTKDMPQKELLTKIEETLAVVSATMDTLSPERLEQNYPIIVFGAQTTTAHMLIHLATHLTYHLGQINYHRRLLDGPAD